jgi:hypothetical protein
MPRIYRPGTYARPNIIIDDTSRVISEEISDIGESFDKRKETLKEAKNAITEQTEKNKELVNKVAGIESSTMDDDARLALMSQLDELNNLELSSFGKDQTEVIKKRKQVQSLIDNFGLGVGLMQAEFDKFKDIINTNAESGMLDSTDPHYVKGFKAMLNNNGKGWSMEAVDGNWIMKYTDPTTGESKPINLQNYANATKDSGFELIKKTKDKSSEYVDIMKSSQGFKDISKLTKEITDAKAQGLTKVVETKTKDLNLAYDNLRQDLLNNKTILASIDENDWKNFKVDPNEAWSPASDKVGEKLQSQQRVDTQVAIVDYLLDQALPNDATGAIAKKYIVEETEKVGAPISQAGQQRIKLAEEKFKYERELDAANEAEFKGGIDFYLDRNLKHVKDMRLDGLFDKDKIKTKKAADTIAALLSEGSAYSYKAVKNKDGDYIVEDAAGEVVTGANTPVGLLDLLNQGTIYAQLETPTDKTAAAKYVASRMEDVSEKSTKTLSSEERDDLKKNLTKENRDIILNAKKGEKITISQGGKTYTFTK